MKKCKSVMSKNPVCCLPSDMVFKAAQEMKKANVGSIPVIENEQTKKLVGIVTDRDLVLKVIAAGLDAKSTQVADVMTHKITTCREKDEIKKVVNAMAENQLRRIPVVDNENKIVGIISQSDVATRVGEPKKTGKLLKKISKAKV
jgi:CBS domain-containing protein